VTTPETAAVVICASSLGTTAKAASSILARPKADVILRFTVSQEAELQANRK